MYASKPSMIVSIASLIASLNAFALSSSTSKASQTDVEISTIHELHDLDLEIVDHFIPTRAYLRVSKNGLILGNYETNNFESSRVYLK